MSAIRAFLGGSFDPIHLGHLSMAHHVYQALHHHRVKNFFVQLLPTAGNPFKHKPTPAHHRLAMLQLATKNTPIGICTYELQKTPPVYTVDTVKHLKACYPDDRLIFVMGKDSLIALPTWKDSQAILNHVSLWVFDRKSCFDDTLDTALSARLSYNLNDVLNQTGGIYHDITPIMSISSSHIRSLLSQNPTLAEPFLSSNVLDYITSHALYDGL